MFEPVEIHFQAMYKHSLATLYEPDHYSQYYYRFAYPSNIVVSAGAGSGKTAVLSERMLDFCLKGNNITEALVLTFTNAAAKEMKERVVEWIRDFFEKNGKGCNAVIGISGGKDSMILAKCFQELKRHSDFDFDVNKLFQKGIILYDLLLVFGNRHHLIRSLGESIKALV